MNTTSTPLAGGLATLAGPPELDVFGCPLGGIRLIEASAGTGKTWAICGLVLRLLLERGLDVQQVLVVTFTEAATAELRARIRSRIVEVLAALHAGAGVATDPFVAGLLARLRGLPGLDDTLLQRRLALALHGFDAAAIFTIHGFCQRALGDAPFSAALPMVSEVITDDAALRDAALKDAWRSAVSGAALHPALARLLLSKGDTPQRWSLLLKRLLARPLAEQRWPVALGRPPAPIDLAPLEAAWLGVGERWRAEGPAISALLHGALGQLNATSYKAEAVQRGAAGWTRLLAGTDPLAELDADTAKKLALFTSSRLKEKTKLRCNTPVHVFFDEAEALLGLRVQAQQALALARCALLRQSLAQAAAALRRQKQQQGLVAFDDMLANLHAALHDPAEPARAQTLAGTLRRRFPAALIDEFQDTDPLQFAIFRKLYGPPDGSAAKPAEAEADDAVPAGPRHSLFLVGDPKQAIYGFRNADLPTYLQARELADADYSLAHNQRSSPALIAALNRLFGRHRRSFMQDGLNYQPVRVGAKPRSVLVDHGAAAEPACSAALQVWRLPEDPRDGLPLLRAEAESLALGATAAEIARLLGAAGRGLIHLDGRPLRAADIAVLVRSHAHGGAVRQALAQLGIGSVELSQASVYHSSEAEELARILAAVLNPSREPLLRAALATELLGRDALSLAASADSNAAAQSDTDTPLLSEMLRFSGYRDTWQQRGIGVMLRRMAAQEQITTRLLLHPQGERRLTNWLHLGECLQRAEPTQPGPQALLHWFDRQRSDEQVDDASQLRLESDQNLVQIVTIHKSKGLEYPFVFCPLLWGSVRRPASADELVTWHDDATRNMVLDFRAGLDPAFDEGQVRQRIALDNAAEDLRLVYVALTRAVHRCVLVAGCSARSVRGGGKSLGAGTHTLLNWLVAGGGCLPEDWLAASRAAGKTAPSSPAQVAAAWRALAAPAGDSVDDLAGVTAGRIARESVGVPVPAAPRPVALIEWAGLGGGAVQPFIEAAAEPLLYSPPPPAQIPRGWVIGSYSLLNQGSGTADAATGARPTQTTGEGEFAVIDHDAWAIAEPSALSGMDDAAVDDGAAAGRSGANWPGPADAVPGAPAADDILNFPRGAAAGECIHEVFEHADFDTPSTWPAAIDKALSGLPGHESARHPGLAAMLLRLLGDVCTTPLLPGLVLQQVDRTRRLTELEFHLPAPALSAAALNQVLERLGYPVPALNFARLQGWLRGFIDLVFEHQGRTYVLDWKSNHLGDHAADYGCESCALAMARHGYHLQALIYALALHRLLQLRRADYDPVQHFGGVFYLFVRGVRPDWKNAAGAPCGVVFDRPSAALLERLAAAFDACPDTSAAPALDVRSPP